MLRSLGAAEERPALDFLHFPAPVYVLDRTTTVRWLNPAGRRFFGDVVGRSAIDVVERRYLTEAKTRFARMIMGTATHNDMELVLLGKDGLRLRARVNATPIQGRDGVVGTFGIVHVLELLAPRPQLTAALTPREESVVELLAAGRSTDQIARELGLARATVRNHVQGVLRRLGAHSRLEAIAIARGRGLIEN